MDHVVEAEADGDANTVTDADVASDAAEAGETAAPTPFRLVVEWAQAITARSVTMIGGRWEQGTFYPGEFLELVAAACDADRVARRVRGTHIDAFGMPGAGQSPGIRFGVVVEGVSPSDVHPGDVLQAVG